MKIGEAKEFFLVGKGTSDELFIGVSDRSTDDVLAAGRHDTPEEMEHAKQQIAQHYIGRGEAIPVLATVRVVLAAVATLSFR
jgi:hypothetical protein